MLELLSGMGGDGPPWPGTDADDDCMMRVGCGVGCCRCIAELDAGPLFELYKGDLICCCCCWLLSII